MKNKINFIIISILFFLYQWGFSRAEGGEGKIKIGILQIVEHPALNKTREGIYDELKEKGLGDNREIEIKYESAQGSGVLAYQIAQKYAGDSTDIVVGIGTTAAQSLYSIEKVSKKPVVFSSVTDPVGAKLVKILEGSGNNVTGVSNFLELGKQLDCIVEVLPGIRRIGYIYNPGESNSTKMINELQKSCRERGLILVTVQAIQTNEVFGACKSLIGGVDAILVSNDNTALAAFSTIAKIGRENKIPVIAGDVDLMKEGACMGIGPNQYEIGRMTGRLVIEILSKNKSAGEIKVEFPESFKVFINYEALEEIDIKVPEKLSFEVEKYQ